jgi:hypothetical protein
VRPRAQCACHQLPHAVIPGPPADCLMRRPNALARPPSQPPLAICACPPPPPASPARCATWTASASAWPSSPCQESLAGLQACRCVGRMLGPCLVGVRRPSRQSSRQGGSSSLCSGARRERAGGRVFFARSHGASTGGPPASSAARTLSFGPQLAAPRRPCRRRA